MSFEKELTVVGAPLLVAIVTGLVIEPLSTALGDRKDTRLEIVDLFVGEGVAEFDRPYEPPRVEVLVRNTGDLVSVVSGAQFEIVDYGFMEICEAGGGLDVSATYDVVLPVGAESVGQVVTADVSQEVAAGAADRFAFALTVPERAMAVGVHVYQLKVALERDGRTGPQPVGTVLVSAPTPVSEYFFAEPPSQDTGTVGECYARNEATFARFEGRFGVLHVEA